MEYLFQLQEATNVYFKEQNAKDLLYQKILDTYELKKKTGISSDLLGKLKKRRRLRRLRHHRRQPKKHSEKKIIAMIQDNKSLSWNYFY